MYTSIHLYCKKILEYPIPKLGDATEEKGVPKRKRLPVSGKKETYAQRKIRMCMYDLNASQ